MYVFVVLTVCLLIVLRNDSDHIHGCKEHPKLELPLITAESLPPPPDPFNRNPSLGPISRFLVFGFVYPTDAVIKWADDHKIGLGNKLFQRRQDTWRAIAQRLPRECRNLALVVARTGAVSCIVVATNGTPEKLKRAEDLDMIRTVQGVLHYLAPPKWYRISRAWWVYLTYSVSFFFLMIYISDFTCGCSLSACSMLGFVVIVVCLACLLVCVIRCAAACRSHVFVL
jgi:hypothetical protein